MIRQLVNRYGDWLGTRSDTWGALGRLLSVGALVTMGVLVFFVVVLASCGLLIGNEPPNNGCQYGHYQGVKPRVWVCDQFYPPPQVRQP